jgi:aminopeptidase N
MAQGFVEYGYTIGAVDETTIAATDAYLATEPEAASALRRLLIEGRDEVARSLRNQARDRQAANA